MVLNTIAEREFLYFRLLDLKETINRYGYNGATMVNLNKNKFENLRVVRPTSQLLGKYHDMVFPMFQSILNLQQRNTNLEKTRDLLLPKLISGEISVETAEKQAVAQGA